MARVEAQSIRALLEEAFPDAAELDVEDRTGTGDHFQVTIARAPPDRWGSRGTRARLPPSTTAAAPR